MDNVTDTNRIQIYCSSSAIVRVTCGMANSKVRGKQSGNVTENCTVDFEIGIGRLLYCISLMSASTHYIDIFIT